MHATHITKPLAETRTEPSGTRTRAARLTRGGQLTYSGMEKPLKATRGMIPGNAHGPVDPSAHRSGRPMTS